MDKPWKVILAFVGVFAAGGVFGGFFALRVTTKPDNEQAQNRPAVPTPVAVQEVPANPQPVQVTAEPAPAVSPQASKQPSATPQADRNVILTMRQLVPRLQPTADQREKMRTIVARAIEDGQRLHRDYLQDSSRVTERMYEDIGLILSPEQRIQLEKMRQESLERARNLKEKQRLESQARAVARPPGPANSPRKQALPEAANSPR